MSTPLRSDALPTDSHRPLIRVVDASLGAEGVVRLVVGGDIDLARLRSVWVSSGAAVAMRGGRLHATTTVSALARAAGRAFGAEEGRRIEDILRDAISAWSREPLPLSARDLLLATDARPLVMGVLNVTPDSFSDGGAVYSGDTDSRHPGAAIDLGRRLIAEGADIVDIGGESTRPGASPVDARTEAGRVVPVIAGLAEAGAVISVDTTKPEVARAALDAGASIVNDTSGARDPELLRVVAEAKAAYVLMHTRSTPVDMQQHAHYDDVVADVYEFLADGMDRVEAAGIPPDHVLVDPGLGFAKTAEHNLALLRATRQLRSLGRPVLIGASRKSFLGTLLDGAGVDQRLEGSLACAAFAVAEGAAVIRVHDVAETVRTVRVTRAIATGEAEWPAALLRTT